jgi:uncharacterized membrane protein
MPEPRSGWTEHQVEQFIGNLLRAGVVLAALVVLAGGVRYLVHYGEAVPEYRLSPEESQELCHVEGILRQALHGHSRGLIQLGLLLLIATPVARVAFSVVAFALQRDGKFVLITLIVFGTLLYSLAAS